MTIHWRQVLVAGTVGLVVGAAGTAARVRSWRHMTSEQRYERLLKRFNSRLSLSPDQKEKVGRILEAKRVKMEALRAKARPQFEELRTSTREEIRKVLDPDQQRRFDEMEARWDARRLKRGRL